MESQLKEAYEKIAEYTAFYTGGDIYWTNDGAQVLCQCNDVVHVVDVDSTSCQLVIGKTKEDEEEDTIYTFSVSNKNVNVVSAHKSGLIKLWSMQDGALLKKWRSGHKGAVARLAFDIEDEYIASGGSEGIIRLWDLKHHTCTNSLRGAMGVFSVLKFHTSASQHLVFGAADDSKIRSWNFKTGKEHLIFSGHFSKVTSLNFTLDNKYMISSGRDKVLILWDLIEGKAMRTLPVYESIEGAVILPLTFKIPNFQKKLATEGIYVACAGDKGKVKVWNIQTSRLMYEQSHTLVSVASEDGGLAVTNLLFNEKCNALGVVTADHNIIIHNLETFDCVKQMIGFSDEILDLIFVNKHEDHIVVATNSPDLKYYNLETMNCQIIKGHTDIVLSLACFPTKPDLFVSCSKDNSVRLWTVNSNNTVICVGVGTKHTASVGSVFTTQISEAFFVSAGQDNCLKIWAVPKTFALGEERIKSIRSELAHQMDINCVAVSPNDKMIATGSQDKTAKLWSQDLSLLGILKGHRRGVWCVKFSPVDQVVATCSADCSIKLWSIADLSCLKTFEGHESSVLKIEFLTKGQQIISSGADGLLKLWNIKTSECKMSLDNHDGKVWSLAINKDETLIITGGSDSKLVKWKDVTVERKEALAKERERIVLEEQNLTNLVHDKKYVKALIIALRLERPLHALKIINKLLLAHQNLNDVLDKLNQTQKEVLTKFAMEWNTNSKSYYAAQERSYVNLLATLVKAQQTRVASCAGAAFLNDIGEKQLSVIVEFSRDVGVLRTARTFPYLPQSRLKMSPKWRLIISLVLVTVDYVRGQAIKPSNQSLDTLDSTLSVPNVVIRRREPSAVPCPKSSVTAEVGSS
ncbi:Transducin beta-like protein 3 [Eumeta japonica]|uniref:Transducin beta-like protein 3 n=1 Tax=Eumeta variegata TaxID=151549 RepID=A0A4C1VTC1_EUMVA|nr:Transducin beta-like protein 3 [Eumeta japonica]